MSSFDIPAPARQVLGLKPFHWICLALIGLTIWLGVSALGSSLTPYVNVAEAKEASNAVQVMGFPTDAGSYTDAGLFRFSMQDEFGQPLEVHYSQPKPGNFDQAVSVVAIGRYDAIANVFLADDLLVKCPSKYQDEAEGPAASIQ